MSLGIAEKDGFQKAMALSSCDAESFHRFCLFLESLHLKKKAEKLQAVENLLKRYDATCDLFPLLRLLLPGGGLQIRHKMNQTYDSKRISKPIYIVYKDGCFLASRQLPVRVSSLAFRCGPRARRLWAQGVEPGEALR